MYTIHLKPEVHTVRVFKEGDSYDVRSSPILSCTVHYISDDEVYLCNATGGLSRTLLRALCLEFYNSDYKLLRYERNEIIKTIDLVRLFKNK